MDTEVTAATIAGDDTELAETSDDGSQVTRKKPRKVPKRVHKSEREKMKREHLNDLFLALANALGHSEANNGKASILAETNRFLKEMYAQIDILRKENTALLSESQYVLIEKNDLKDETSVLESDVKRLKIELRERPMHTELYVNQLPLEQSQSPFLPDPSLHQAPYCNPFYVIPVCPNVCDYAGNESSQVPKSIVSKPHARYPTPSDSWPSQLLKSNPDFGINFRDWNSNVGDVVVEQRHRDH